MATGFVCHVFQPPLSFLDGVRTGLQPILCTVVARRSYYTVWQEEIILDNSDIEDLRWLIAFYPIRPAAPQQARADLE